MNSIEIQCLCGSVAIRLTGDPIVQTYCHCDDCQAAHGAAYVLTAAYQKQNVEVLKGELVPLVVKTAPRMRCSGCGTLMFIEIAGPGLRSVNAARFPKGKFKPQFHLQCQHAVLPVVDNLPHYKGFPAAFGGSDEQVSW